MVKPRTAGTREKSAATETENFMIGVEGGDRKTTGGR